MHVADIDADAEDDTAVGGIAGREFMDAVLELVAARTASTALGNSARKPSPVLLTIRPPWAAIAGTTASARELHEPRMRRLFVMVHQPRVPHDICNHYRREPPFQSRIGETIG